MVDFTSISHNFVHYFEVTPLLKIVLFITSIIAIFELVAFSFYFFYYLSSTVRYPDANTHKYFVLQTSLIYIFFRLVPLPFIYASLNISSPVVDVYLPYITSVAIILLGIWLHTSISIPTITMWFIRMRYGIGEKALTAPQHPYKFIVIIPVYNEKFHLLVEAIQSLVDQKYPTHLITIHVSFDDDSRSKLYLDLLTHLNENSASRSGFEGSEFANTRETNSQTVMGSYQGIALYVHKFRHGGKRHTQAATIDYIYKANQVDDPARTIIFMTDSDSWTYPTGLNNFASTFNYHPEKMALAGYMSCMSKDIPDKFWARIQSCEYTTGELSRSMEMCCGTICCLPGSCTAYLATVLEVKADGPNSTNPETVRQRYFNESFEVKCAAQNARFELGEDRYLTAILHVALPKYSIGFTPCVRQKTEPPTDISGLIRQRRRWALGAVSNDVYMITDSVIWSKYPVLCLFKTVQQAMRQSFFSQMLLTIMAFSQIDTSTASTWIPLVVSAGIPIILSVFAAFVTAISIHHYKVFIFHLPMLVVMSLMQVLIDFYALFSFTSSSWGGSRIVSAV